MAAHTTHRFAQDTESNRQAWVWVASVLALIYSTLFVLIRVVIKWKIWGLDDSVLAVAYIVSLFSHIANFIALPLGLAEASSAVPQDENFIVSKLMMGTSMNLLVVIGLARLSVLLFVRRIYAREIVQKAWHIMDTALTLVLLWTVAAPLLVGLDCDSHQFLTARPEASCRHQMVRLKLVGIGECVAELFVTILPMVIFTSNNLRISQRIMIFVSFGCRLTFMPVGFFFFRSYSSFLVSGRDNIDLAPSLVVEEVMICYSLILASIPCLRIFIRRFKFGGLRDMGPEAPPSHIVRHGLPLTRKSALQTFRHVAERIHVVGTFSVFDTIQESGDVESGHARRWQIRHWHHRGRRRARTAPGHEIAAGTHWTAVFDGPPGTMTGASSERVTQDGSEWRIPDLVSRDWEKTRAIQIVNAPHRTSIRSVHFITTAG